MKKLITFFPPIVFMCLIVILGACGNNPENPELKRDIPTDSASIKPNTKDNYQEIKSLDSTGSLPPIDSILFDKSNTVHDTIPFENETHVIPTSKPTFKVFSKYMKLHSKGPIV